MLDDWGWLLVAAVWIVLPLLFRALKSRLRTAAKTVPGRPLPAPAEGSDERYEAPRTESFESSEGSPRPIVPR